MIFKYKRGDEVNFTLTVLDNFQREMKGVVMDRTTVLEDSIPNPGYYIRCEDGCSRECFERDLRPQSDQKV